MSTRLVVAVLTLMLIGSGAVGAVEPWNTADTTAESLEDIIVRMESDIQRAIEGASAHPAFLTALEGYVAELYGLLSGMRSGASESEWGQWEPDASGTPAVGSQVTYGAGDVLFSMRLAPAATFPVGLDDSAVAVVHTPFWIAETQVTYELWHAVRQWALGNGYTFANPGREGSHGKTGEAPTSKRNQPVTMASWNDTIVWANALSEMLGYEPVYTYQNHVIRDSTNATACEHAVQENTNGFRLPTSDEWELAARYKGTDSSHGAIAEGGLYWTPGNFASGATADYNDAAATKEVAWYSANNSGSTQDVGLKRANSLGLYDMAGNVWEWCFTPSNSSRVVRGGSYNYRAHSQAVGNVSRGIPGGVDSIYGRRLVRTEF